MCKKIITISIILLALIGFSLFYLVFPASVDSKITGVFSVTKGCMGSVNGTLLVDFVNKCEEATKYEGKTVEVVGHVYEQRCIGPEQCSAGPRMNKIKSIKILE